MGTMIAPQQHEPTAAEDSIQGTTTQNTAASFSDGNISKPNNAAFVFLKKEELERGSMAEDMVRLYATTCNSSSDSSINQKRLKCRYKKLYEFVSSGSATDQIEVARRIDRVLNSAKDSKGKAISKWTALDYLPRECSPDNLKDDHLLMNHIIQSLHKRTEARIEVRKKARTE